MTFELGVNYWPRRRAMYMWREFDLGEVRDDMAHIASIGFDVVRVFALTEDLLPRPLTVATGMVERLVEVSRCAKDAGLTIVPTLIVLNMSGRIWWPAWMLDAHGHPADLFSDPAVMSSQALLVETCARALSGDDAIRAFDLANEIDDAQRPRTRDDGRRWASVLANAIRVAAPGRPTLMQEFGLCTAPPGTAGHTITDDFLGLLRSQYRASEDEAAEYYDGVLERLLRTGASGAYAWCYGDYDAALFDRPPFATAVRERTFGLVRADGREKPAADVFRRFRQRRDAGTIRRSDVARTLDVSGDEYYRAPATHFERLYACWLSRNLA